MKYLKWSLIFILFCINSYQVSAQVISGYVVPFQNVIIKPGNVLVSSYNFGSHNTIFCFSANTQTVGAITWMFQGQTQFGQLPIFLITSHAVPGQFADPVGGLVITNNTNQLLQVGCLFGY